jgi:hypothetical protein
VLGGNLSLKKMRMLKEKKKIQSVLQESLVAHLVLMPMFTTLLTKHSIRINILLLGPKDGKIASFTFLRCH